MPTWTLENTLQAFEDAKQKNLTSIEFDVSMTKDEVIVVLHGPTMYTTTCPQRRTIDFTYDFIVKNCPLKNGETVMRLQDMLPKVGPWFDMLYIDLKVDDPQKAQRQTLKTMDLISSLGFADKTVMSSYDPNARYLIASRKDITGAWDTFSSGDRFEASKFHLPIFLIEKEGLYSWIVEDLKAMGKDVVTFTIKTEEDFEKAFSIWVKRMMTNNVEMVYRRLYKHYQNQQQ